MNKKVTATLFAVLAAAFYAINVPFSKLLMAQVSPTMMAAFLYLGAGLGLLAYSGIGKLLHKDVIREPLTKAELPYTVAMVLLDILAPILLMYGIRLTASANVSLLNNFEIVATALIALAVFGERISLRLAVAIGLVTAASILLGFEGKESLQLNEGALFVVGACVCWGIENNCTRKLSGKSSVQIVTVKGCGSGLGSLILALAIGEKIPLPLYILAVLALGFVAYGLSINFYILAQKDLGAAKTSAYYAIAPFLGVAFSMLFLGERPGWQFYAAFAIMAVSTVLMIRDSISLQHTHEHTHVHTHPHRHGDQVHTHEHAHTHVHLHTHGADSENHGHGHKKLSGHEHAHSGT